MVTAIVNALGYLGGLFEARFYQPHSTTDDPREEIREAASLYGLDLAMMMSIAKVESDFDPRVRTGSYKGLFQLSDYEFKKYGDGSIWPSAIAALCPPTLGQRTAGRLPEWQTDHAAYHRRGAHLLKRPNIRPLARP